MYTFLVEILITLGVMSYEQVNEARWVPMDEYSGKGKQLGEIRIELGYITKEDLHWALSLQKDLRQTIKLQTISYSYKSR